MRKYYEKYKWYEHTKKYLWNKYPYSLSRKTKKLHNDELKQAIEEITKDIFADMREIVGMWEEPRMEAFEKLKKKYLGEV